MNKFLKILLINIIGIALALFCLEVFCLFALVYKYSEVFSSAIHLNENVMWYFKNTYFDVNNYSKNFREPSIKKTKKGSVILFGCSFTSGDGLKLKDSFSGQLSDYTNRSVYNRAQGGSGPQLMLFQLSSSKLKQEVPEAQYIIYTMLGEHTNRIYKYRNWPFLTTISIKYKIDRNNNLVLKQLKFPLGESFIIRLIDDAQDMFKSQEEKNQFLLKILEESYNKAQILYPNVKFVILEYSDAHLFSNIEYTELIKKGFIVLNLKDLSNKKLLDVKYQISPYDSHPNAKLWNIIVPSLTKKLHL